MSTSCPWAATLACSDSGTVRQEGKDYVVHDGDILLFTL